MNGIAAKSFGLLSRDEQYNHPFKISEADGAVPIIGVDFWHKYAAVFDCRSSTIELDSPDHSRRVTIDMRVREKPQPGIRAVCRTMTDIFLPAGHKSTQAHQMVIDYPVAALRRGMAFHAMSVQYCVEPESVDPEGEEMPLFHNPGENATPTMPEMIVSPVMGPQDRAFVSLAVANPGHAPLCIPRGTPYAVLSEIGKDVTDAVVQTLSKEEYIASVKEAHPDPDSDYDSEEEEVDTKELDIGSAEKFDLDGLEDGDQRHNLSAEQIVQAVEAKQIVHELSLEQWLEEWKEQLHFGPLTTDAQKQTCGKLLYAFSDVIASKDGRPGYFRGIEHCIELISPDVTPGKVKDRRRSPVETAAIKEELDRMYAPRSR